MTSTESEQVLIEKTNNSDESDSNSKKIASSQSGMLPPI